MSEAQGIDRPPTVLFKLAEHKTDAVLCEDAVIKAFPGGAEKEPVRRISFTTAPAKPPSLVPVPQNLSDDSYEDTSAGTTCDLPEYSQILSSSLVLNGQVGSGAFCVVEKAEYTDGTGKRSTVAVKSMKPVVAAQQLEVDAFVKEAHVMASIQHRNIVQFRGMGSYTTKIDGGLFVVQEFLAGGSLKTVLMKQARSWWPLYSRHVGVTWMLAIAEALAYLHSLRPEMVIHRDLKSDNIFLSSGSNRHPPRAKLGDFGLHRRVAYRSGPAQLPNTFCPEDLDQIMAQAPQQRPVTSTGRNTLRKKRRGSWLNAFQQIPEAGGGAPSQTVQYDMTRMCGSLLYMAPEVYNGASYCEKCDVFSLGVVMFEIATRTPMATASKKYYPQTSVKAFVKEIASGARLPIPKSVPHKVAAVIQSCWEQDPSKRCSASHAVEALKGILRSKGLPGACFGSPRRGSFED